MLKNVLRQTAPPFIFSFARAVAHRLKIGRPVYEGVFASRAALPQLKTNPFEHPHWLSYVAERAESRKGGVTAQDMHEMCLSLVASIASAKRTSGLVVDFGGGVGMYWPAVKSQHKTRVTAGFVVVDNPRNCEAGRRLFGADGVEFCFSLDQVIDKRGPVHLLNVASTLQYCLDYEATVQLLCRSDADFIVVSRHPAIDDGQPVAYTVQNVTSSYGFCGQIGVVLLSVQLLTELMSRHGYTLIADYFSTADVGKYWKHGKQAVEPGYARIVDHALVFQKQSDASAALQVGSAFSGKKSC